MHARMHGSLLAGLKGREGEGESEEKNKYGDG